MVNYHIQQLGLFLLQVPQEHESIPVGEILSCVTDIYNHSHDKKNPQMLATIMLNRCYISLLQQIPSHSFMIVGCWVVV